MDLGAGTDTPPPPGQYTISYKQVSFHLIDYNCYFAPGQGVATLVYLQKSKTTEHIVHIVCARLGMYIMYT